MGRTALGKGLKALIPDISEGTEPAGRQLMELPVSEISSNPYQPRAGFGQDGIEELKRSIAEKGVIQPIIVKRTEEGYQLIAGERRLLAVKQSGGKSIPALVVEVSSPEEMMELALIENIQREDLNPIEEAKAYQTLIQRFQITQEELSQRVGKDRSTIANSMRLLRLSPEIQEYISEGKISAGHARALLSLADAQMQHKLCQKIVKYGWSVRRAEKAVQDALASSSYKKRASAQQNILVATLRRRLQQLLGTEVKIERKGKKGKIEILFDTEADLERIVTTLEAKLGKGQSGK